MLYALLRGDHAYQPWSLLEVGFWALTLHLLVRRRERLILFLIAAATLNRETSLLNVVLTALVLLGRVLKRQITWRDALMLASAAGLVWGIVYGSVHLIQGDSVHVESIHGLWTRNLDELSTSIPLIGVMIAGMLVVACIGFVRSPFELRWATLSTIPYLILVGVYGVWIEVRLLLPLVVLLIPLVLFTLRLDMASLALSERLERPSSAHSIQ